MNSCQSRVNLVMNSCQYYDSRGEGELCWCVYYTWVVTVLCMSTEPLLLRLGRSRKKVRTWSGKNGLFTDLAIYIFTPGRSQLAQFEIRNLACFVVHKVHLWSALGQEKVRKRWTEKTKVRTWSVFSGPCPDLFPRSPQA